jgi:peroxiredoxin Q/BCP
MISTDKPEDNKAFADKEQADFPMLSDPGMKIADAYGVLALPNPADPAAHRMAKRWTFYIDPQGVLVKIDKTVHVQTAGADLIALFDALKVPKKK